MLHTVSNVLMHQRRTWCDRIPKVWKVVSIWTKN